jgi:hypothetical protein
VRTVEFNVALDQLREYTVTPADIDRIRNYIRGSIRDMKELLRDPEGNDVARDDCPLTTEEWRCRHCNFKRLCGR